MGNDIWNKCTLPILVSMGKNLLQIGSKLHSRLGSDLNKAQKVIYIHNNLLFSYNLVKLKYILSIDYNLKSFLVCYLSQC